jgi:hypothetical protein
MRQVCTGFNTLEAGTLAPGQVPHVASRGKPATTRGRGGARGGGCEYVGGLGSHLGAFHLKAPCAGHWATWADLGVRSSSHSTSASENRGTFAWWTGRPTGGSSANVLGPPAPAPGLASTSPPKGKKNLKESTGARPRVEHVGLEDYPPPLHGPQPDPDQSAGREA